MSAWVLFTADGGTDNPRVLSTCSYELWTQTTSSNRLPMFGYIGASVMSSNTISSANWYHLVGVRAEKLLICVNGRLEGAAAASQDNAVYPKEYVPIIRGNSRSSFDSFAGLIDDVRIYDRVLSAQEVAQLYEYESTPIVTLVRAVKPSFSHVLIGRRYQLQLS